MSSRGYVRFERPGPRVLPSPDPRLSRSMEYGIAILECYSSKHRELGIAELADVVGISRSTAHRYAATLRELGFLEQDAKHKYRLARRAADAGSVAIEALRKRVPVRAVLEELRHDVSHTVSMGVLDRSRVVYVDRLLGHRPGQYEIDAELGVGVGVPVYCTALGKVLLASLSDAELRELLAELKPRRYTPNTIVNMRKLLVELDRVSPRGVVVSNEEMRQGSRSIAVLVPSQRGEPPIAIDVTVPSSAYTISRLVKEIGPRLKRTAKRISNAT